MASRIDDMLELRTERRLTLAQIAEKYGLSRERVRQLLDKAGVRGYLYTKAERLGIDTLRPAMTKWYSKSGASVSEVAEKYGIAKCMARKLLGKHVSKKKHKPVDTYFDNIDSHRKAYLYGYFYACAHVCDNNGQISFCRGGDSVPVLNLIQKEVAPTSSVSQVRGGFRLIIPSRHMNQVLKDNGFVTGRLGSDRAVLPEVPAPYLGSFMLGYWEARGTVRANAKASTILTFYMSNGLAKKMISRLNYAVGNKIAGMLLTARAGDGRALVAYSKPAVRALMRFMCAHEHVRTLGKKEVWRERLRALNADAKRSR